jgi:hypothetical protein
MTGLSLSLPVAALVATPLALATACAPAMNRTTDRPPTSREIAQLWTAPANLRSQNLFYGPGGRARVPGATAKFRVLKFDGAGNSVGYDVEDARGREWKAKLGEEVQPEIVASRLLWAVGFHQPAMHYVANFHLDNGRPEDSGQPARLRDEHSYKTEGDWSWHENPFVGTRQLNGLLVANLLLNNWDLKPSQNRIYVMSDRNRGRGPVRRFVVQDLGAALGKTGWPTGNRNDIDGFEQQNLIRRVVDGQVEFDYEARHTELFKNISPADVVWVCRLFSQLSDRQWQDAFRAANYSPELSARFIAKLKSKVREGLALDARASAR